MHDTFSSIYSSLLKDVLTILEFQCLSSHTGLEHVNIPTEHEHKHEKEQTFDWPWPKIQKKRQVSWCVTSSRFSVCYVLCPPIINNLSGVVKDTGGVSDLEHGHDHRHDTYFGSEDLVTEFISCMFHQPATHMLKKLCYCSTDTPWLCVVAAFSVDVSYGLLVYK